MVRRRAALLCALVTVLGMVPVTASGAATPASAASSSVPTWDLTQDMAANPSMNPAPDSYGNAGVWSYEEGQFGDGSDPASNTLLSPSSPTDCNDGTGKTMSVWGPTDNWAPLVGLNPCNAALASFVHPGPAKDAVVDWQSPVTGTVTITGTISSADPGGGNGIAWSLYQGSSMLAQGTVADASSASLPDLGGVAVTTGQHLYLRVNDAGNTDNDTTDVAWTISEPATQQTSTSLTTDTALPVSGTPVTYTAHVSPTPAGGTVAFAANGTAVPACAAVTIDSSGTATCAVSFSGTGNELMTAAFSGYTSAQSDLQPSTSSPLPVDVTQTLQLAGVSCATNADCAIAGTANRWQQDAAGPAAALIATEHGGFVDPLVPAAPKGSASTRLDAVSCASVASCLVVGSAGDGSGGSTAYAVKLTPAGPGKPVALAAPDAAVDTASSGISCPSASCFATGSWTDDNGHWHALLDHLTSTGWHALASPRVNGYTFPDLTAVSCSDATDCTAVGFIRAQPSGRAFPFVDRLAGGRWRSAVLTDYPTAELDGVSCPTATWCAATGTIRVGSTVQAFAAERNGTTWRGATLPNSSGNKNAFLTSVSCWNAGHCMAAGFTNRGAGGNLLVEKLQSGTWHANNGLPVSGGDPSNADMLELDAISCASADSCVAVGNRTDPTASGLVETWNGTRWTAG